MKIVLDTNVLVSGLISPFNAPGKIVQTVSSGTLRLCYDARILAEYKGVLHRPCFNFNPDHVSALLDQIKAAGRRVVGIPLPKPLPDSTDEPFLEAAIAGKAACLVTGNLKHYPPASREGVNVLAPADFLIFYRKR